jgi:predicted nucleotidyltransferase
MSMMVAHIAIPKAEIAALCRRNGIRKLALFGSVLTDRFSDRSDINVLVEFRPHERIGFFRLAEIQEELSRLLDGRTIDLRTPMDLSRHFREEVVPDAVVVYAEPRYHSLEAYARGRHDGVAYGGSALPD